MVSFPHQILLSILRSPFIKLSFAAVRYYGTSNFADCTELYDSLNALMCQQGRVQEYVSHWRTGVSRLQSVNFPFSIKVSISHFIHGLPLTLAFFLLRSQLPQHVLAAGDRLSTVRSLTLPDPGPDRTHSQVRGSGPEIAGPDLC